MAATTVTSNLTGGAVSKTTLSQGGGRVAFQISIPPIPNGGALDSFGGSSINTIVVQMRSQIKIAQDRLKVPNGPPAPYTVSGLNQVIVNYTSLITQFETAAAADLATAEKQQAAAAPAPAPAPAPTTTAKPATTTATSTTPVIKTITPVPVVTPFVIPAPRVLGATITNPLAPPAPAYQLAISNPVPNPVLKPPTDASIKSLITPTPIIKVEQPALIPSPPVVAPTITNPFAKTAPDPNAIVNVVPNPKLNTKVPPGNYVAVTPITTITSVTPALIPATPKDQLVVTPVISAGTPALIEAPKIDADTIVNPFDAPKLVTQEPLAGDDIIDEIPNPDFEDEFGDADGPTGDEFETAVQPTQQDQTNFEARKDWRVRLALAPDGPTTKYMYRAAKPGILEPLLKTDGVVFPYTPSISVNYSASYEPLSPVHSNYKINQYTSSSVDSVSITCDFTAQDVAEANYLLAVIHFFRSMTKMFYGQDEMPKNGTPPPLCYLFGMGEFQFSALPLAITGFNYTLPNDVDYIKTTAASPAGTPQEAIQGPSDASGRLGPDIGPGGVAPPPDYGATPSSAGVAPTYVPTKIQLAITCIPMMSRNMVSNRFSLREYANGKLLNGTTEPGGGMW